MAILHRKTLGNIWMLELNASPNGSITAPLGSIAMDSTNGKFWQNTDAGTTWVDTALPAGAILDTDYNAQTVIVAVADDTPVIQIVGDSEFVGRAAGGNVGVVTKTAALTILNVEDGADVTDFTNVNAALAAAVAAVDINDQDLQGVAQITQKDHAAFTGSDVVRTTAAVQTTNATPTTLISLALADDSVYFVEASIVARDLTVGGENAYKEVAKFSRRTAGAAVLGSAGSVDIYTDEEDIDWNVEWIASTNNAVLQVTGEAAITINWAATITYQRVSAAA